MKFFKTTSEHLHRLFDPVQLKFHFSEGEIRRKKVQVVKIRSADPAVQLTFPADQFADASLDLRLNPEIVCRRTLDIEVPDQGPRTLLRCQEGQVDRDRSLPYSALEVVNADDPHPPMASNPFASVDAVAGNRNNFTEKNNAKIILPFQQMFNPYIMERKGEDGRTEVSCEADFMVVEKV